MAKDRTLETITAEMKRSDSGRAFTNLDSKTGEERPAFNSRYLTMHDLRPKLIEDAPDVLDDLGLKEARQNMDEAHNKYIQELYKLILYREAPGLYTEKDKRSPRETLFAPKPAQPTAEQLQRVIDSVSLLDNEYREAAKGYLTEVLPVAEAETKRLQAELNTARAELAEIVQEYRAKVRKAEKALKDFNAGIHEEVSKFEYANSGGQLYTEDGQRVNIDKKSANAEPIFNRFYYRDRDNEYKGFCKVEEHIKDIEAASNEDPAKENYLAPLRAAAAANAQQMRDTQYIPGAGISTPENTGADGLKSVISNIFK